MKGSRQQAVIMVLVLALVLTFIMFDQVGDTNPIRDLFSQILSPLQYALKQASEPVAGAFGSVGDLRSLRTRNETLEQENAELRSQLLLLREARIENETLRELLSFQSSVPNYHMLAAEVIGHDPNNMLQYLILDRGAADGLEQGMPVLTAAGLVGRISKVNQASSQVMLITDASSSVSALIQRSRATGLVQGYVGNDLMMRYLPQGETIEPGDIVLTSGLGGNFPKRIVIGQVVSIENRDVDMFQQALVVPAADLHDLETVMVVLNFTPTDLATETDSVSP